MYHRDFIREYALNLKNLIESVFVKISFNNHDDMIKSFSNIMKPIVNMLMRVYSIKKTHDEIKRLKMNFIIVLLKSKDEDLKYQGMRMLSRELNQARFLSSSKNHEEMYKWINENAILSIIYDSNNYSVKAIAEFSKIAISLAR